MLIFSPKSFRTDQTWNLDLCIKIISHSVHFILLTRQIMLALKRVIADKKENRRLFALVKAHTRNWSDRSICGGESPSAPCGIWHVKRRNKMRRMKGWDGNPDDIWIWESAWESYRLLLHSIAVVSKIRDFTLKLMMMLMYFELWAKSKSWGWILRGSFSYPYWTVWSSLIISETLKIRD